jgi:hypothetical protein
VRRLALCLALPLALPACSRSFHPEYHPVAAYSYVQNVTYAHNVSYGAPDAEGHVVALPAGVDAAMAQPYLFEGAGEAARPEPTAGTVPVRRAGPVTSPGAVVVYGNVNGNIVLGR